MKNITLGFGLFSDQRKGCQMASLSLPCIGLRLQRG